MINTRRPPSASFWHIRLRPFVLCLLFLAAFIGRLLSTACSSPQVMAQFDPIISTGATVSATMPDIIPPTAPILIAPEDGAIVSTNRPQFVWRESTDNVEMSHYQLHLNGELVLDNIALTGSFELYDLSYDPVLGHYFLNINFNLDQGDHTWKIVAVDGVGLTTDSATWSFLVDSIAPYFVLTDIGDASVSISAQDDSTIPEDPIQVGVNQPTLTAKGEANSTVQLTVIIPGQDNYFSESTIDSSGSWSYQLPILPRDTIITLNFVIIDQAMHITALEGVRFVIPSEIILLPRVTATPTPDPLVTPVTPVTPEPTPRPIVPIDPIEIPYRPPKEIVHEIYLRITPTPILRITRTPWFTQMMRFFGPWSVLLVVSWPIITATILLSRKFGSLFSPSHFKQIWRALGVLPFVEHQGWAFDATRYEIFGEGQFPMNLGIPFVKITAISQSEPEGFPPYYHTAITNHQGLYPALQLPLKHYKLAAAHPDYRYPTLLARNNAAQIEDFYKAESMEVTIYNSGLSLQIPADNDRLKMLDSSREGKLNKAAWSWLTKVEVWLSKMIIFKNLFVLANILTACLIILYWPTTVNLIALSLYLLFGSYYLLRKSLVANIKGLVIDQDGHSVQNVLVRLIELDKGRQTTAALSDKNGRFNFFFKKGRYKLMAVYPNGVRSKVQTSEQGDTIEVKSWLDQQRVVIGSQGT